MFGSTFTGDDDEPEDYFTWEQRTMNHSTTPNTAANGGQILTDERILATIEVVREHGHFPSLIFPSDAAAIAFGRAIEADLRALAAVPAGEPEMWRVRYLCTAILNNCVVEETKRDARMVYDAIEGKSAAPAPVSGMPDLSIRLADNLEILNKRPRPMCRDCADEEGTCPHTGLSCNIRALIAEARATLPAAPAPTEQQDELPITRSTYGSLEACEAEQARRNAAPAEQAEPPYRVYEFWSSASPGTKVRMLAEGDEIDVWPKRGDFIRDVTVAARPAPTEAPKEPLSEAQLDHIARSYFAEPHAQENAKNAIHDAFLEARQAPAEQDPGEPYMFKLPGDHDWQLGFAPLPEGAFRLKLLVGAPDSRDAALEEAATLCDAQALEPECPERATYCADAIRALKGPGQ